MLTKMEEDSKKSPEERKAEREADQENQNPNQLLLDVPNLTNNESKSDKHSDKGSPDSPKFANNLESSAKGKK